MMIVVQQTIAGLESCRDLKDSNSWVLALATTFVESAQTCHK